MRFASSYVFVLAFVHVAAVAASLSPTRPDTISAALAPYDSRACKSADACIDAVLATAQAGRHIDQLSIMATMGSVVAPRRPIVQSSAQRPYRDPDSIAVGDVDAILSAVLGYARLDYAALPEHWRTSALFLLKSNNADEAEQVLRDAISLFPTQAAFWTDLALVFGHQNKADQAVAALVVADTWSGNPAALRQGYAQAAKNVANKSMAVIYTTALQTIAQNDAALERYDASLPAISLSSDAYNATKGTAPIVQFDTCEKPQYPRTSARYEESGRVTIAFYVGADGKLLRARKLESSGHIELDHAALTGIAACAFEPVYRNGKAVPAWAKVQYVWSLE